MITKSELIDQLKSMGLQPWDTVVFHSSMKAIGDVEDGPEGVLDALCQYFCQGLVLIPTHTWEQVTQDHPVYDVRSTVPDIGLIPRTAAFRKDGIRSLHPTHSLWAFGKRAEEFVAGEEKAVTPTTTGFCWDKIADWNGKILLCGVCNDKNTFIHAVEERAGQPDRLGKESYETTIYDHQGCMLKGKQYNLECSKTPDISIYYGIYEKPMVEMGVQTFGWFGHAKTGIVDAMGCRKLLMTIFARATEDIFASHEPIPEALYR